MRRQRTLLVLALVAAVLAALLLWDRGRPSSDEAAQARARLWPSFTRAGAAELTVERDGVTTALRHEAGGWYVTAPHRRADDGAVEALLGALEYAQIERRLGRVDAATRAQLGLASPRVRVRLGGHALAIGGEAPARAVYVLRDDEPEVLVTEHRVVETADLAPALWRSAALTLSDPAQAMRLGFAGWAVERRGGWRIVAPVATRADEAKIDALVQSLGRAHAKRELDDGHAGPAAAEAAEQRAAGAAGPAAAGAGPRAAGADGQAAAGAAGQAAAGAAGPRAAGAAGQGGGGATEAGARGAAEQGAAGVGTHGVAGQGAGGAAGAGASHAAAPAADGPATAPGADGLAARPVADGAARRVASGAGRPGADGAAAAPAATLALDGVPQARLGGACPGAPAETAVARADGAVLCFAATDLNLLRAPPTSLYEHRLFPLRLDDIVAVDVGPLSLRRADGRWRITAPAAAAGPARDDAVRAALEPLLAARARAFVTATPVAGVRVRLATADDDVSADIAGADARRAGESVTLELTTPLAPSFTPARLRDDSAAP